MGTKSKIMDDMKERVFTVNMTDLGSGDSDYYCFAVEINHGPDIQLNWFHITVTSTPAFYVEQQEVTGVEGGEVTVYCYYSNPGIIKWCPVCGGCVENSGTLGGALVTLNQTRDAKGRQVFTVNMSGLKMESTGWYWCYVGDNKIPVHITVIPHVTTPSTTTTNTPGPPHSSVSSTSADVVNTSRS
ncbi:hypothetical protein DPEC_G00033370, partial [Dallia pectoralis]